MTKQLRFFEPISVLNNRSFEQIFHDFFDDMWLKDFNRIFEGYPVSNVFLNADENKFEIEIAVPGFKKEEIQIEIDGSTLIVTAEHQEEKTKTEDGKIRIHKRLKYDNFVKSYRLPSKCDLTKINADLNNGILTIHVPFEDKKISKNLIPIK